ncbi:hypothetical protein AVEN_208556-1 [Araneus ventricosus]|uniref:Uncharacterized protein n=1 Tax=Araneus ventricosus TaxID=182803 RepID=A0A4Y2H965_ARAVE|nr:hypothetical protein AVEN_223259-1 [Araneus ventricosus]GBM60914.1 hypothetical protein AVEN_239519-1 [Araneus ventricosus]GBM61013.1 hypothetical protein AVEN_137794-1 [Araneus ventricosus]GBM61079.1 hypothetical protein AVEN_208556-1 [Araneus ventricosus]
MAGTSNVFLHGAPWDWLTGHLHPSPLVNSWHVFFDIEGRGGSLGKPAPVKDLTYTWTRCTLNLSGSTPSYWCDVGIFKGCRRLRFKIKTSVPIEPSCLRKKGHSFRKLNQIASAKISLPKQLNWDSC